MDYSVLKLQIPEEWKEIFIAELFNLGFDMMEETGDGLEASIESTRQGEINIGEVLAKYSHVEGISAIWEKLETVNWNEEWEKNYDPVRINNHCLIRADFHDSEPGFDYEILINPRMSFGTGHHPTTWGMVDAMVKQAIEGSSVLDAGSGTGVLAILAKKMGAQTVKAYDISQLCVDNSLDNAKLNFIEDIEICTGTIREMKFAEPFDFIFANINRNALLDEIPELEKNLKSDGTVFLSGFFTYDKEEITRKAKDSDLRLVYETEKQDWAVLGFKKII